MFHKVLDLLFPEACVICGKILGSCENGVALCPRCLAELIFLDEAHTCKVCGCPIDASLSLCTTCQTHQHHFDRAFSCFAYKDGIRRAVLRYKFYGRRDHFRTFSCPMHHRILPFHRKQPFDCMVCAPLSKADELKRGYHQTKLLAEPLSKSLAIPFLPDAFCKIKETKKQSTMPDYLARLKNVEKAFALAMPKSEFKGKNILLIDDVLTTGATADALAKLLKGAGAASVTVATFATTQEEYFEPTLEEDEWIVTY